MAIDATRSLVRSYMAASNTISMQVARPAQAEPGQLATSRGARSSLPQVRRRAGRGTVVVMRRGAQVEQNERSARTPADELGAEQDDVRAALAAAGVVRPRRRPSRYPKLYEPGWWSNASLRGRSLRSIARRWVLDHGRARCRQWPPSAWLTFVLSISPPVV
jgi:hypothetical protein